MTPTHRAARRRHLPLAATCLLCILLGWAPTTALAGGYASARFGGARGTVVDTTPAAVYYNPGALGFDDRHAMMLDLTLALRQASYRRDAASVDDSTLRSLRGAGMEAAGLDALTGEATLQNLVASPFVGASSDLGLETPLRLGAAFFVPFGGQSAWDRQAGSDAFAGAGDGPARWYNIEGTIRSLALGAAAAYRLPAPRLSLGLSLTTYFSEVDTLRARNANGGDGLVFADGSLAEGRSLMQVSGTDYGVGAGLLWEALAQRLWLGLSYQSQPGLGTMELEGTLENTFATASPSPAADVRFTQQLPDIYRLGARYRPWRRIELRLSGDYTRWSHMDQMCLAAARVDDMGRACATGADGSLAHPEYNADVVQVFQRRWRDTFGARAGGMYFLSQQVELNASIGYDSNAIPDAQLDAALFDMDKLTFSAGANYALSDALRIGVTLTEVYYASRDTRGSPGNETLAPPSRQPGNQGVYAQNILLLNAGLEFRQ